jgi:hypothetical protein
MDIKQSRIKEDYLAKKHEIMVAFWGSVAIFLGGIILWDITSKIILGYYPI